MADLPELIHVLDSGEFDEPGESRDVQHTPGKKIRKRKCPLCQTRVNHLKKHAAKYHLPWFLSPSQACFVCKQHVPVKGFHTMCIPEGSYILDDFPSMSPDYVRAWVSGVKAVLDFLMEPLGVTSWPEILELVNATGEVPNHLAFTPLEVFLMEKFNDLEYPGEICNFNVRPLRHVISLFHWRVMLLVLSLVPVQVREQFHHLSFSMYKY